MAMFSLEPLAARHGDCLLLHYGAPGGPGTILIDGGPSQVWSKSLKPRLMELERDRPGDAFAIDLLIVSHIDDDHVVGLVDMTGEWREAKADRRRWPWPVRAMWHNSFERIAGGDPAEVRASVLASVGGAASVPDEDGDEDRLAAAKVLASVAKGAKLRADAEVLGIPVNAGSDGLIVPGAPVRMGDLELLVVGPLPAQLEALRNKFATELPKGGEAALAAYTDDSVPNLSSIVVLATLDGRRMLLTGDARGDFVLEGLGEAGVLDDGGGIHVDVLKLQHHGSERNTETDFFRRVTADHYVASANGEYENPDRATFQMIFEARGPEDGFTIHLTYEMDDIDARRREERASARATALAKHRRNVPTEWDDEADSLASFFAARRAEGRRFEVETPATRKSRSIDLGDPVGF